MKKSRQKIRRILLLVSMLAFPVTLYYFSPYLIINGAFSGILAGSAITFAAQFLFSLVLGAPSADGFAGRRHPGICQRQSAQCR